MTSSFRSSWKSRWARALLLAFVLLVAIAISRHIITNQGPIAQGVDFRVFERASNDPAELVYRDHPAPFAYPPTALILMKPLTALGYWFWIAVSALAFAASTLILAGRKVAALSFLAPAAMRGMVHGQVAMLLGGLLFAGLIVPPLLGGVLWGVAISVKPQLMFFAPLALLVRRDWRMLVGMALGSLLMVAASLTFLDPLLWERWVGAVTNFNEIVQSGAMARTITPASAAVSAGLPSLPFILAGLILGTFAVIAAAPKVEGVQLIALVIAASLVASPYAHVYDSVALIPACAALLLKGPWVYAIPAGLIFMGTPIATVSGMVFVLMAVSVEARLGITIRLPTLERKTETSGVA